MEILVFTDSKTVKAAFEPLLKKKDVSATIRPAADMRKSLKNVSGDVLLYYDVTGLDEKEWKKDVAFIRSKTFVRYVIIDPKNSVADPASEFFAGCSDYLGKNVFSDNLNVKRIAECIKYRPFPEAEKTATVKKSAAEKKKSFNASFSGSSWTNVKQGTEYVFAFMYFEFTNIGKLTKQLGVAETTKFLTFFHNYLEKAVLKFNGKIWIWNDNGGVVLFPFDGKNTLAAESALELYLNQPMLRFDDYAKTINLKLVLHCGKTTYNKRGNTGTIISDTINSLYHIGQKFSSGNRIFITDTYSYVLPDSLKAFFRNEGEFEGNNIFSIGKK